MSPGEVLIAISASGNSPNVLEATSVENSISAVTIGLTGFGGGELASLRQISVVVPGDDYVRRLG